MGIKGEPDDLGTGRYNITEDRKTIGIMILKSKHKSPLSKLSLSKLTLLLKYFFLGMKVRIIEHSLEIDSSIIDTDKEIEFPI